MKRLIIEIEKEGNNRHKAVITSGAFSKVYPACKTESDALLTAITAYTNKMERNADNEKME
jgi:hypothetical protein